MNIADSLHRRGRFDGDAPAVAFEGETSSYGELDRRSGHLAAGLRARGVGPGDRVALLLPNSGAFLVAYFAAVKLGAVAVSMNVMSPPRELSFVLQDSGARALVVDASLAGQVEAAPGLLVVVAGAAPGAELHLENLVATSAIELEPCDLPPEAPAAILYTSGTTGVPKGATLSHANVISNAQAAASCYGAKKGDRFLLYLPLFHCFGQNAVMNAAIGAGASLLLLGRFACDAVLELARAGEVTHFFGVPSVYVRLLEAGVAAPDFERVRFVFSAAAPLPLEVAKRWHEATGRLIHEGYGLTESSPFATYDHRTRPRPGSVGTPVEGVEVRIVDGAGLPLGSGELGEIEVRGPNVMLGYWNRARETSEAIRDGWLRTGDVGRMDDDGYLYVVDRLKEMIIVSGFKVYPSEVERILHEHPAVSEPAVFGVPHPVLGESVHAHVVLRGDVRVTEDDLRGFCKRHLATYKVPAQFTFTDSLPKNATGKVLRRALRDAAIARSVR